MRSESLPLHICIYNIMYYFNVSSRSSQTYWVSKMRLVFHKFRSQEQTCTGRHRYLCTTWYYMVSMQQISFSYLNHSRKKSISQFLFDDGLNVKYLHTSHSGWDFSWFCSAPSGKCWETTLNQVITSFQTIYFQLTIYCSSCRVNVSSLETETAVSISQNMKISTCYKMLAFITIHYLIWELSDTLRILSHL
jgi:hypothetical protein